MAACYTKDFLVMPTNRDIITSIPEFQKFWQGVLDLVKAARFDPIELEEHGDTAIEVGRYTMSWH